MNLIRLENVYLALGEAPLLNEISLIVDEGEKICLIGRNGMGKSTLMRVIAGFQSIDSGSILKAPSLRLAYLNQALPNDMDKTVYEFIAESLSDVGQLLTQYHALAHKMATNMEERDLKTLEILQKQIESKNGWEFSQQIENVITQFNLDPDKPLSTLSGGWQRKAALAQALVTNPNLLLLDEPTNHLDIESIEWLENFVNTFNGAIICITHDRRLMNTFAQKIIELDRGKILSLPGNYEEFLERKEHLLQVEEKHFKAFDKKLAQEEAWIRQGVKARRTRNEGRVRALKQLRAERLERRDLQKKPNFKINDTPLSGKLVIEALNINYDIADKKIVKDFSLNVFRNDKIALIGPNGVGKTTLLKLLLQDLAPQTGSIRSGTELKIAYFDQKRVQINPALTVVENVAEGREAITINGKTKHIISYLSDFLFTPERALTPVKLLSGGECNRMLLARLFSQPFNLLVMDEPTNDLDMESLELLEEILTEFDGTLLLVSHDRKFVDNIATSLLVFKGNGIIEEHVGGYSDWERYEKSKRKDLFQKKSITKPELNNNKNTKLENKDQQELSKLPKKIESLEKKLAQLHQEISEKSFYEQDPKKISKTLDQVNQTEKELQAAYIRWETLENLN
ncbi:MAG: transporter related protein [Francisellaceae bacterium]|nr:transporter related protein [Francisellaceae bacterium]